MAEDLEENQDEAAAAFEALRAEVAALRQVIEQGASTKAPDYAPTLGEIARRLGKIEGHPALRLTPEAHGAQVRQAVEAVQRSSEHAHRSAAGRAEDLAGQLQRLVDQARLSRVQDLRLLQVGAAALLGGGVLWASLSGPIARRLPASWQAPEKMAAATMAEDRATAGQNMIASQDPHGWAETVRALRLYRANRDQFAACEATAARTGKPQRCSVRVEPGSAAGSD